MILKIPEKTSSHRTLSDNTPKYTQIYLHSLVTYQPVLITQMKPLRLKKQLLQQKPWEKKGQAFMYT